MQIKRLLTIVIVFCIHLFVLQELFAQDKNDIRYVPIGDSYTIGTGAKEDESWPAVLTEHLKSKGYSIRLIVNPARAGWSTEEAIAYEMPVFQKSKPNFSTLMIGVNDWVRGVDAKTFRNNFSRLLDDMLVQLEEDKLLIINIPDFSYTPKGPSLGEGRDISQGIAEFNRIIKEEAKLRNLRIVNIFSVSKEMREYPSYISADGLHPSAQGYAFWEKIIFTEVELLLKK